MTRLALAALLALAACTGAEPRLAEGASDLGTVDLSPPEPPEPPGINFDGQIDGALSGDGKGSGNQDNWGDGA